MSTRSQPSLALTQPSNVPRSHYTYFIVPFGYELGRIEAAADVPLEYHRDDYSNTPDGHLNEGSFGTYLQILDDQGLLRQEDKHLTCEELHDLAEARRDYLLPETRLTLFSRARWFRLQEQKSGNASGRRAELSGALTPNYPNKPIPFRATVELFLLEWDRARRVEENATGSVKASAQSVAEPIVEAVGFLLFVAVLDDSQSPSLETLLDFNERMRYLKRPYKEARSQLTLWLGNENNLIFERGVDDVDKEECYWELWEKLISHYTLRDEKGSYRLAPTDIRLDDHGSDASNEQRRVSHGKRGGYPDDRAFTYTLACVAGQAGFGRLGDRDDAVEEYGERVWSRLLNVDGSKDLDTCGVLEYQLRWIKGHTYKRWLGLNSLYGYTDFSAALLVKLSAGREVDFRLAYYHYHLMYLDQLLLLLYERVTLYLFSAAISNASHEYFAATHSSDKSTEGEYTNPEEKKALQRFHALREQFMLLTNLYQFPMFTTQYQGQEMYTLARKSLRVEQLYKEVETEVRATDEWLAQRATEEVNARLQKIQFVGLVIVLAGIALSALQASLALFQLAQSSSNQPLIVLFQLGQGASSGQPNLSIELLGWVLVLVSVSSLVAIIYLVIHYRQEFFRKRSRR